MEACAVKCMQKGSKFFEYGRRQTSACNASGCGCYCEQKDEKCESPFDLTNYNLYELNEGNFNAKKRIFISSNLTDSYRKIK